MTSTTSAYHYLTTETAGWLNKVAAGLDTGAEPAERLLPALAAGGLTRVGVPRVHGGDDGDVSTAIEAIAEISSLSLAAGFVLWGHRTYIEYLLQSANAELRTRLLPDLLAGRIAGATGLSNAMKFLAGLEELQIEATPDGNRLVHTGKMPWVTNLRTEGFHVAAAVALKNSAPLIVSFASDDDGVDRTPDLDLFALRATNTAAISLAKARIGRDRIISDDAVRWLPIVRPAFLGLQCGMSIGLARRSLAEAKAACGAGRSVLVASISELEARLNDQQRALLGGIASNTFREAPAGLFRVRIALANIVAEAVALELQAAGGRAYLASSGQAFARRWREAAFIPIVTPSLVQLKTALASQPQRQPVSAE